MSKENNIFEDLIIVLKDKKIKFKESKEKEDPIRSWAMKPNGNLAE